MEKETKHTPGEGYTGLTEFEGKVLEAMMGGRDNVLNNKLDSMEQLRLSLCAKGAAAFLQTELSEMKKEREVMLKLLTIGSEYLPNGYVHHKGEFFDYRGTLNEILKNG